jgi:hypothetical protein
MMKYHLLLPPVILALCGCHSDQYCQEQAVEMARKYIYKHARELTPEEFAFVKFTPPTLLTGNILGRNADNQIEKSLHGNEKMQICITWRIPGRQTDYMVFGVSGSRMAYWTPARLIRRKLSTVDQAAVAALSAARTYAVDALYKQLSAGELNRIRLGQPELVETKFELNDHSGNLIKAQNGTRSEVLPAPWKNIPKPEMKAGQKQLSLVWKISEKRCAVFCGIGGAELEGWQIVLAGVFPEAEFREMLVKSLKKPAQYLTKLKEIKETNAKQGDK